MTKMGVTPERRADVRETGPMSEARRLVTLINIDAPTGTELTSDRQMSILAVHQLELVNGRRVTLLDDRGWSSSGPSGIWSSTSLEDLTENARLVVGPDEPAEGRSHEDEAAMHWAQLAANAQGQGVHIEPGELAALAHDVEISPGIRARLTGPLP
jgi:hypothetical protein